MHDSKYDFKMIMMLILIIDTFNYTNNSIINTYIYEFIKDKYVVNIAIAL